MGDRLDLAVFWLLVHARAADKRVVGTKGDAFLAFYMRVEGDIAWIINPSFDRIVEYAAAGRLIAGNHDRDDVIPTVGLEHPDGGAVRAGRVRALLEARRDPVEYDIAPIVEAGVKIHAPKLAASGRRRFGHAGHDHGGWPLVEQREAKKPCIQAIGAGERVQRKHKDPVSSIIETDMAERVVVQLAASDHLAQTARSAKSDPDGRRRCLRPRLQRLGPNPPQTRYRRSR